MPSVDYARKWKEQNLWLVETGRRVSENIIEVIVVTERERLVELLKNDNCPSSFVCDANCKYINSENCLAERIADYLLENGVIVPPVKVGATVYCTDSYRHLIKPLEIIGFEVDYTKRICKYYCSGGDYTPAWFKPAEMGKTVFLTREEAEKALKESEQK